MPSDKTPDRVFDEKADALADPRANSPHQSMRDAVCDGGMEIRRTGLINTGGIELTRAPAAFDDTGHDRPA